MIFGIGTDIIEVERIKKQISKGNRFKEKIFTHNEIQYCESRKAKAQNYAARFAAKEAFFKAIGTGWRGGLSLKEIEIANNKLGKPEIVLFGKTKELTEQIKVTNIQVSLSHLKDLASAIVVLEK